MPYWCGWRGTCRLHLSYHVSKQKENISNKLFYLVYCRPITRRLHDLVGQVAQEGPIDAALLHILVELDAHRATPEQRDKAAAELKVSLPTYSKYSTQTQTTQNFASVCLHEPW